jgi:CRISPR-associated protein Csx3
MSDPVIIDLKAVYGDIAKLDGLPRYVEQILAQAGEGRRVILTGAAPVWLYLKAAHALHGKARTLVYTSPASGEVLIFDHNPFG